MRAIALISLLTTVSSYAASFDCASACAAHEKTSATEIITGRTYASSEMHKQSSHDVSLDTSLNQHRISSATNRYTMAPSEYSSSSHLTNSTDLVFLISLANETHDVNHLHPAGLLCATSFDEGFPERRSSFASPRKATTPSHPIYSPFTTSMNFIFKKDCMEENQREIKVSQLLDSNLTQAFKYFLQLKTLPAYASDERRYLGELSENNFMHFINQYKYMRIIQTRLKEDTVNAVRTAVAHSEDSTVTNNKRHLERLLCTHTMAKFMQENQQYFLAANLMMTYLENAYFFYYEDDRYNENTIKTYLANMEESALGIISHYTTITSKENRREIPDADSRRKVTSQNGIISTRLNLLCKLINSSNMFSTKSRKTTLADHDLSTGTATSFPQKILNLKK